MQTRAIPFFFRPTPLGFCQVVQPVRLHVATRVNWLIDALMQAIQRKPQKLSWRGPTLKQEQYQTCAIKFKWLARGCKSLQCNLFNPTSRRRQH
jgi:hypothetical protein